MTLAFELVVARYKEPLDWLALVPVRFRIIVYDKGGDAALPSAVCGRARVVQLPNQHRESGTYLHHITTRYDSLAQWTAFCQGNPFDHSPDFVKLLDQASAWRSPQCLTWRWGAGYPPPEVLCQHKADYIGTSRVYREPIRATDWTTLRYADDAWVARACRRHLDIADAVNLTQHLLRMAGTQEPVPEEFCFGHGAAFAVKSEGIRRHPIAVWQRLLELHDRIPDLPWVLERLWLLLLTDGAGTGVPDAPVGGTTRAPITGTADRGLTAKPQLACRKLVTAYLH